MRHGSLLLLLVNIPLVLPISCYACTTLPKSGIAIGAKGPPPPPPFRCDPVAKETPVMTSNTSCLTMSATSTVHNSGPYQNETETMRFLIRIPSYIVSYATNTPCCEPYHLNESIPYPEAITVGYVCICKTDLCNTVSNATAFVGGLPRCRSSLKPPPPSPPPPPPPSPLALTQPASTASRPALLAAGLLVILIHL